MRVILFVLAACTLLVPRPTAAQDWIEYANTEDFFSVNFPGQPTVEAITYTSGQGAPLPGRVYSAERGEGRYSMTVVDYTRLEEIQQERVKNCPPDAHMSCVGTGPDGPTGSGYSKLDKAGPSTSRRGTSSNGALRSPTSRGVSSITSGDAGFISPTPTGPVPTTRSTCTTTVSIFSRRRCRRGIQSQGCSISRCGSSTNREPRFATTGSIRTGTRSPRASVFRRRSRTWLNRLPMPGGRTCESGV